MLPAVQVWESERTPTWFVQELSEYINTLAQLEGGQFALTHAAFDGKQADPEGEPQRHVGFPPTMLQKQPSLLAQNPEQAALVVETSQQHWA